MNTYRSIIVLVFLFSQFITLLLMSLMRSLFLLSLVCLKETKPDLMLWKQAIKYLTLAKWANLLANPSWLPWIFIATVTVFQKSWNYWADGFSLVVVPVFSNEIELIWEPVDFPPLTDLPSDQEVKVYFWDVKVIDFELHDNKRIFKVNTLFYVNSFFVSKKYPFWLQKHFHLCMI